MGLESLTGSSVFTDSLVNTNPTSGDSKGEGDDHLRGIKNVLLNTWPNITGQVLSSQGDLNAVRNFEETVSATISEVTILTTKTFNIVDVGGLKIGSVPVTTTAAELNKLDGATATTAEFNTLSGVTSAIQTQLDAKASTATGVTNGNSHDHNGGDGAQIPTGGIADGAVTTAKLATGAVTANEITSATITTTQIAADTITEANMNWSIAAATPLVVAQSGGTATVPVGLFIAMVTGTGAGSTFLRINGVACSNAFGGGALLSNGTNITFINTDTSGSSTITLWQLQ